MKNYKRLLLITSEFPPQPGGIGNHAFNLATQLQMNGYKVTVIADVRSKNNMEEQQFDKILPFAIYRVKRFKILLVTYFKRIITYRKLAKNNSLVLASGKFPLWLVGLDPFLNKNKKYVVVHGSELNLQGIYKKLTDSALKNFNKIIAVSNYTKSLIGYLNLKNIEVIPNGFKLTHFEKLKKHASNLKKPVLITIGKVSERKGQLNVIKALPSLVQSYPKIHYHIAGIPTEQVFFKTEASKLKVLKYITFHGKVNEQEKYNLLDKSDVLMLLSNETDKGDVEGFGIVVLEANSLGIPAIGSINSGVADTIKNEFSGKLVYPENVKEIKNALKIIMNDYENYSLHSEKWSKKFDWSIIIKKYLEVFK